MTVPGGRLRRGGRTARSQPAPGRSSRSAPGSARPARRAAPASGPSSSASARPARCCSARTAWASSTPHAELDLGSNALPPGTDRAHLAERQPRARARRCSPRIYGLGFSRFASLGNQADLEAAELVTRVRRARGDTGHRALLEDFRDGRAFAGAQPRRVAAGKPVVLLAGRRSEASAGAPPARTRARSSAISRRSRQPAGRRGSSASRPRGSWSTRPRRSLAAPCRAGGASPSSATEAATRVIAADLASPPRPRASRPSATELARSWPRALAPDGRRPATRSTSPAAASRTIANFVARSPALLLESGEVDAVAPDRLLRRLRGVLGRLRGAGDGGRPRRWRRPRRDADRPLVVQTMYCRGSRRPRRSGRRGSPSTARSRARSAGCPARRSAPSRPPRGVPDLPAAARTQPVLRAADGYFEARELLGAPASRSPRRAASRRWREARAGRPTSWATRSSSRRSAACTSRTRVESSSGSGRGGARAGVL